jgi:TetR/AcrR family transcriptional repressor of lmrAB and yxaGH operons
MNDDKNRTAVGEDGSARARFIETMAQLLERQGYYGTGLNEVVQQSGAPKGSLYYYFPGGKEELAAEAIADRGRRVADTIRSELARVEDPVEAIHGVIAMMGRNMAASGWCTGGPITSVALETSISNQRLRDACGGAYAAWEAAFSEKIAASGCPQERADRLATVITAAMEGAIILARVRRCPDALNRVASEIRVLLEDACYGGSESRQAVVSLD